MTIAAVSRWFRSLITVSACSLTLVLAQGVADAATIYVDASNTGAEDGSQANPYNTINEGINNSSPGDTISVADGTYNENVYVGSKNNLTIQGQGENTIVADPNQGYKFQISSSQNITVEGFHINGGEDGIYISSSTGVIIRNNKIENTSQYSYSYGGAFYATSSEIFIQDNIVSNTYGGQRGGAGYISYCEGEISGNQFLDCDAWNSGGGLYVYGNSAKYLTIKGNLFTLSHADYSGAIDLRGYAPANGGIDIRNNIILTSGSDYRAGGAVRVSMNSDTAGINLFNNIIKDTYNPCCAAAMGVYATRGAVTAYNNIFDNNTGYAIYRSGSATVTADYNDNYGIAHYGLTAGANSLSSNPQYVNESANDLHLAAGSPCINAGNPASQYNDDDGSRNDIGAYGGPILPPNNAPVANNQNISTAEDVNKAIVLTASDADGDSLTYSIVANPANGALSGVAPNVTYIPNANFNGSDTFTFKANDGQDDSNIASVSITVTAVNDTPVANSQSTSTSEDVAKAITLTGSDVDGDSLTYSIVSNPNNGSLSGSGANRTYTPNANFNGSDSFTFRVNDGTVNSAIATVSITVNAVNDAPIADNQSTSTSEDVAKAITLTGSDVDGDSLTYSIVSNPNNGSLSGSGANRTYTPGINFNGSDSFTFRVNDGTVNSGIATVSITVNAVNDAPIANGQSIATAQDTPKAVTLTASDVDGDTLTYSVVSSPANGSLSGSGANRTYTPNAGYTGSDSFTFKANDGTVDSGTATISISVTAPDPIVYVDASNTGAEDGSAANPYNTIVEGVANASNGDTISIADGTYHENVSISSRSDLTIQGQGVNTIITDANQGYKFSINNSHDITIEGLNISGGEDGVFVGSGSSGITFRNNRFENITQYNYSSGGALYVNNAEIFFIDNVVDNMWGGQRGGAAYLVSAEGEFKGNQFIDCDAWAEAGGIYISGNVSKYLTIKENYFTLNHADRGGSIHVAGQAPADGGIDIRNNVFVSNGADYQGYGDVRIAPSTASSGINFINNIVKDTFNPCCGSAIALYIQQGNVTVYNNILDNNVGFAIVRVGGTVTADYNDNYGISHSGIAAGANSISANPLYVNESGGDLHLAAGSPCIDAGNPASQYDDDDGSRNDIGAYGGQILPPNNAPLAFDQSVNTEEDVAKAITLTATDGDGDPLTYSIVANPSSGSLSGTAPNVTYTPNAGFTGLDSFTFKAHDGIEDSNIGTVTINVTDVIPELPPAYASKLEEYAETTVKYFTSTQANNKVIGFPHAFFGTGASGEWRECLKTSPICNTQPWALSRGYGSHINVNEITLRFLSLAAAYKMDWLDHFTAAERYDESWGQILVGLQTLRDMQDEPNGDKYMSNTFHRAYLTATNLNHIGQYDKDRNYVQLGWDGNNEQSSDDNGLPYMNLLILEGLANDPEVTIPDKATITNLCHEIRDNIDLRRFYKANAQNIVINGVSATRDVIFFNYDDGKASIPQDGRPQGIWDRMAAEGSLILAAMLVSDAINTQEFYKIAEDSLPYNAFDWDSFGTDIPIEQATFHSALFIHGLRSLHGMPVTAEEHPGARYANDSVLPIFDAHVDYADVYGKNALGSQAMTQPLEGYPLFESWTGASAYQGSLKQVQFPGNENGVMPTNTYFGTNAIARSTAPHAFFIPLARQYDLDSNELDWIFGNLAAYETTFFNDGADPNEALGWEAVIPWTPNDTSSLVSWVGSQGRRNYTDWGRPYEALNTAYTVLHAFDALNPEKPLASYSVEAEKLKHIAAFIDSGTPLPPSLFP